MADKLDARDIVRGLGARLQGLGRGARQNIEGVQRQIATKTREAVISVFHRIDEIQESSGWTYVTSAGAEVDLGLGALTYSRWTLQQRDGSPHYYFMGAAGLVSGTRSPVPISFSFSRADFASGGFIAKTQRGPLIPSQFENIFLMIPISYSSALGVGDGRSAMIGLWGIASQVAPTFDLLPDILDNVIHSVSPRAVSFTWGDSVNGFFPGAGTGIYLGTVMEVPSSFKMPGLE